MYKKIFSAILFGVLTIASTSTFVSCKDYDDDINNLQAQIDELNNKKIAEINSTITELKNADANLQKAIEDAKADLKKDISDGDAATLAAAKSLIAEAIADCQKTCGENLAKSQQEQNEKYDEAIAKVNQRVDDIVALLKDQEGNIVEVGKQLQALSNKLSTFESEFGTLSTAFRDLTKRVTNLEDAYKAQQAALEKQQAAIEKLTKEINGTDGNPGTAIDPSLKQEIEKAGSRINDLENKVKDLQKALNDKFKEVMDKIGNVNGTVAQNLDDLRAAHENFATKEALKDLADKVSDVKAYAETVNDGLTYVKDVITIILGGDLRSLVYMPYLYIDGIETVEYPYLSDTTLAKATVPEYTRTIDKKLIRDLNDYRPSTNRKVWGPAWAIYYNQNPSSADPEYKDVQGFYAYQVEVITRAGKDFSTFKANQASSLCGGITSPEKYDSDEQLFKSGKDNKGVLKAGIRVKNPDQIVNEEEGTKNIVLALQVKARTKESKDTIITSDYAMLYPEKIWIEGLIWKKGTETNELPTYWYKNDDRIRKFWENEYAGVGYGAGSYRNATASYPDRDWDCPWTTAANKTLHVWETPTEALDHPADIELFVHDLNGVNLQQYMGVHYVHMPVKENDPNYPWTQAMSGRGTAKGDATKTWKRAQPGEWAWDDPELERLGLRWQFDLVDYVVTNNTETGAVRPEDVIRTHDSRYSRLDADAKRERDGKSFNSGVIIAANVTVDGDMVGEHSATAVDREPLVRVRLYHKDWGVENPIKDGYIRIHITQPELLEIEYPKNFEDTKKIKFELCDGTSRESTWSQFSRIVLTNYLDNMERKQFNALYSPEIDATSAYTTATEHELVQYVKKEDYNTAENGSASQLGRDNDTHYYGFAKKTAAQKIGRIMWRDNDLGTTNDAFRWVFTAEELEALTHDQNPYDKTVTVETWIHYTGHFEGNAGAKYDDIFIHLVYEIYRTNTTKVSISEKIRNAWKTYDGKDGEDTNRQSVALNCLYPQDDMSTINWRNDYLDWFVQNYVKLSNSISQKDSKFYFAPREVEIKALNGNVYIVTPRRGSGDNVWNKFMCLYVTGNTHEYKLVANDPFKVDEAKNNDILNQCAIRYQPDAASILAAYNMNVTVPAFATYADEQAWMSKWPKCDGVFSNDTLYAVLKSKYSSQQEYEPIAVITNTTTKDLADAKFGGAPVVYYHEYIENKWLPATNHNTSDPNVGKENVVTEELVNAYGYDVTLPGRGSVLGGNPLNKQVRGFVGVIANHKCNIATQMSDEISNFAVFQSPWERPINLVKEDTVAIDAKNNASYLYAVDLLKLYDWRGPTLGYMWGNQQWLWAYYNVKAITFDCRPSVVLTNLHQTNPATFVKLNTVSTHVHLYAGGLDATDALEIGGASRYTAKFDLRTAPNDFQRVARNNDLIQYMGLDNDYIEPYDLEKARFGFIKYENNGENVEEFDVIIPVTVTYEWGDVLDEPVRIHIIRTMGN